jgi:hypothetical protein
LGGFYLSRGKNQTKDERIAFGKDYPIKGRLPPLPFHDLTNRRQGKFGSNVHFLNILLKYAFLSRIFR